MTDAQWWRPKFIGFGLGLAGGFAFSVGGAVLLVRDRPRLGIGMQFTGGIVMAVCISGLVATGVVRSYHLRLGRGQLGLAPAGATLRF
jgi:hypothetical protein